MGVTIQTKHIFYQFFDILRTDKIIKLIKHLIESLIYLPSWEEATLKRGGYVLEAKIKIGGDNGRFNN